MSSCVWFRRSISITRSVSINCSVYISSSVSICLFDNSNFKSGMLLKLLKRSYSIYGEYSISKWPKHPF